MNLKYLIRELKLNEITGDDVSDGTITFLKYFESLFKNKNEKDGYIVYYSDTGQWTLEAYDKFKVYNFNFRTMQKIESFYESSDDSTQEIIQYMINHITGLEVPTLRFRTNREVMFIL